ncbi:alkaline phosphatase family protein [Kitasatospora camelliae]|uniref:Alkaline phosphatase family protein n=1 Tax=Kitasatospora camelliae TaxID=3156397 RepID=A0AAU8K645_9ACTN
MLGRKLAVATVFAAVAALTGAGVAAGARTTAAPPGAAAPAVADAVPRFDHIVVVPFENKDYGDVIGSSAAPYINSLASQGASFTQSFGVTHPSQGNYVALFSGSQQGVTDDSCPKNLTGKANLGSQLIAAGLTFKGYSEGMPSDGFTGCSSSDGAYVRKHNPWVDFDNVPAASNVRYSTFPTDYSQLPTVSFVVPDMCNDMHGMSGCSASIPTGDSWLRDNLDGYAQWAKTHNSLLVVTFDEDNFSSVNQIATVLVGAGVRTGTTSQQINHYNLLRTIEDAYGLTPLGNAASAAPITGIWTTSPSPSPTPSPTGSPSPSPSPSPTGTPAGIVNGGFEYGTFNGWTRTGTTAVADVPHSGAYSGATGATTPTNGDSVLSQTFTAPPGASKLTIWWKGDCRDTVKYAWATVVVKHNTSGTTATPLPRTCIANGGWQQVTDTLTPGHSYTVQLVNHDDNYPGDPSITWFDDLTVS